MSARANEYRRKYIQYFDTNNVKSDDEPPTITNPEEIYDHLFRIDGTQSLAGYSLSLEKYIELFSQPGISRWTISFGYNRDHVSDANSAGFQLMVHGQDEEGLIRTGTHLLTDILRLHSKNVESQKREYDRSGHQIPRILLKNWSCAWRILMNNQRVDSAVLKIPVLGRGLGAHAFLRGYTFSYKQMLDVLDVDELQSDSQIRFYLVNEAANTVESAQKGTIGIVVASYESPAATPDQALSSVYNFSRPCPPTC